MDQETSPVPTWTKSNAIQAIIVLAEYREGCLVGEGTRYDINHIVEIAKAFDAGYPGDLPQPHVYPMDNGYVCFEWHGLGRWRPSLEVNSRDKSGYWINTHLDCDDVEEIAYKGINSDLFAAAADLVRSLVDNVSRG